MKKTLLLSPVALSLLFWIFTQTKSNNSEHSLHVKNQKEKKAPSMSHSNRQPAQTVNVKKARNKKKVSASSKNDDPVLTLEELEACYQNEGQCGFPLTDPKSEFFAIGQEIKKELLKWNEQVLSEGLKDAKISEQARHFLKLPDGHVKEAALHLISSQEPSTENLQAILDNIINYHDAHLITHAMLELRRYLGKDDEDKIHAALANALMHGSPLVAEQISRNIHFFITRRSHALYQRTLEKLNLGSISHRQLRNALAEYKKQQQSA